MTTINGLFQTGTTATITSGANQLAATAELTSLATTIMNDITATIKSNEEHYAQLVADSMINHDKMDSLITEAYVLADVNIEFLKSVSTDDQEKMLRSQQSKRSRIKAISPMTFEHYKTLMTAAIAENLLRITSGKPKSYVAIGTDAQSAYSEERLTGLAADQNALGKELRNLQSKKSIAKSKANFNEDSEKYQQLLRDEEVLKSLRIGRAPAAVKEDKTAAAIKEAFGDIDPSTLKSADAKTLLAKISELIK